MTNMLFNFLFFATGALAADIYIIRTVLRPNLDQAWVPVDQSHVTTFMGAGGGQNREWALRKDSQRPGYFTFYNIGATKFVHIEDETNNIVVGDEQAATSFYIERRLHYSWILKDDNDTVGWSIKGGSPDVVLRDLTKDDIKYSLWDFEASPSDSLWRVQSS